MNPLFIFQISESQSIQILIDEQNKVNRYGYESEGLHIFDEVEVRYIGDDQETLLATDIVREIVDNLYASLEEALNNKLSLDKYLAIGKVGYFFSKATHRNNNRSKKMADIIPKYWVWSLPTSIQTWLYTVDNTIYLEISPIYSPYTQNELYISFDKYANSYKPIVVVELQKHLVQAWIHQSHSLLQTMEEV